ncbi:MAG: hypothetical protein FDX30_03915 [Chlorobium sp.]|nr:MAG: hypothetical protein FDX30_03915 [Chlorobium sp.]
MALTAKKDQRPPGPFIWISVTLLWGTVFFFTSIFMLKAASDLLRQGFFNPSWREIFSVYGIHAAILVVFALAAMLMKRVIDPGSTKQVQRWQDINEGKGEKIFISFAGSIATSFFFTGLTAANFSLAARIFDLTVEFSVPAIFLAALFNIAAGLAASLIVGIIFLVGKVGNRKG